MVTVIGIAGGSASGKTTVACKLIEASKKWGKVVYLRFDDYYKDLSHLDLEERRKVNFDHPSSVDMDLLYTHLLALKNSESISKPTYDFVNYNRGTEYELIEPGNVIILEGIFTLVDERIRDMCDIKLFVDIDPDIRFIRRLTRDMKERGRSVDSIIKQYMDTVRPMYLQFIEPSKRYADIIIPKGGFNQIAIDMVLAKISSIFKENVL